MNSTFKIFVDASHFNKEFQGSRTYIKELYTQLAISFPDVGIYFAMMKDDKIEEMFKDIENIHFIHLKRKDWLGRMLFEIPDIIKKNEFSHAHFQYTIPFRRSKKCKYIVTIHDVLFNDFKDLFPWSYRITRNLLFSYSAKNADIILTVSEYSKERIEKFYSIDKSRIHVTANGVSSDFFKDYNKEDVLNSLNIKYNISDYFLYVSRIEPRKNQASLLKAFLKLKSDKQLVFIGKRSIDYPEFDMIFEKMDKSVKHSVHFIEQVDNNDLLLLYQGAFSFVYPSLAEGFGIPPLEASAVGIPVLCSNLTAMKEFNFYGEYHYNANDQNALENKLSLLIEDFDSIDTDSIKEVVKKKYSWSNSAQTVYNLLE